MFKALNIPIKSRQKYLKLPIFSLCPSIVQKPYSSMRAALAALSLSFSSFRGVTQILAQARKGKNLSARILTKARRRLSRQNATRFCGKMPDTKARTSFATKYDQIMYKSVRKCPTQKCENVFRNKIRKIYKESYGKMSHSEVIELEAQPHSIAFGGVFPNITADIPG